MKWEELRDLDLRDVHVSGVGDWPIAGKAVIAAILIIVVLVIGYFLVIRPKLNTYDQARNEETGLRQTFERKQHLAANLDAYKIQLETMRKKFGALLLQLPSETEIPDLLAEVSQTAREDGLTQTLFQPRGEIHKGFYAEKPINMAYSGSWEQIAKFVSDVAALPRIVTLGNFSLKPDKAGVGATIHFTVTGTTYRYLTGDEGARHGKHK